MTRAVAYAAVFAAVLWGGLFIAAVNTLTDDPTADW